MSRPDTGAARHERPASPMSDPRPDSAERPDLPEGPRTVLGRFAMPADDWARDDAARGPRTLDAMMLTLLVALAVAAGAAVAWHSGVADGDVALAVIIVALTVAGALAVVAMRKVRRDLHSPLSELYAWALGMCTGDFSTRIPAGGRALTASSHFTSITCPRRSNASPTTWTTWCGARPSDCARRTPRWSSCTRSPRRFIVSNRWTRSSGSARSR